MGFRDISNRRPVLECPRTLVGALAGVVIVLLVSAYLLFQGIQPPNEPFVVSGSGSAGDRLVFAAVGDAGSGKAPQIAVANALARYSQQDPLSFVLFLGDEFYPSGVTGESDPQWVTKFERMYTGPGLEVPFFAVLGNHDYDGNPEAILEHTLHSSRWRAPGRYYTFRAPASPSGTVQFFAVDTFPLRHWFHGGSTELDWLETQLRDSKATWKIAFGHHPLVSGGKHEHSKTTSAAKELLLPLFRRYGVQLYLSGHDHNLQVIEAGPELVQVISGGGGAGLYPVHNVAGSLFSGSRFGFAIITVTSAALTISMRSETGESLFTHELKQAGTAF